MKSFYKSVGIKFGNTSCRSFESIYLTPDYTVQHL